MEEELQSETSAFDDAALSRQKATVARRRMALAMFLNNPQGAADEFPELIGSLRMFVGLSTNPFADPHDPSIARVDSEHSFDEWNQACRWSNEQNYDI